MTTNISGIFNGVLKGAHNLPITTLVQLTFYRVNSYFTSGGSMVPIDSLQVKNSLHILMPR